MSIVSFEELLDAGVHFGHRTSRWNPKMARYIFGKRNDVHIIDLRETVRGIITAYRFLEQLCQRDAVILFVGTKRQARDTIRREAERCNMYFVNERWIGGLLTNFRVVRKSCDRLIEIEKQFETGAVEALSKKELASLTRERRKLTRTLEGVKNMKRLPDALVVIDSRHEENALREAKKLNIVSICLTDTDSDPEAATICIPGNDDSMRAVELLCTKMADAVLNGRERALGRVEPMEKEEGPKPAEEPAEAQQEKETERAAPEESEKKDTNDSEQAEA